jgi:hypothetical protein
MFLPVPKKCKVRLDDMSTHMSIDAMWVGMVHTPTVKVGEDNKSTYNADALVQLLTFSKGTVYQVPFRNMRVEDDA